MSRHHDRRRAGRYAAARRAMLGLTQPQLADRADVDPKTVRTLEKGERWPIATTRAKIESALGWDEGDLVRVAEGQFPVTGPLPPDDPDGLVAAVRSGIGQAELEEKVRAVIADLPPQYQSVVEELYEQLLEAERRNHRLMSKIVRLPVPDRSRSLDGPDDDDGLASGPHALPGS